MKLSVVKNGLLIGALGWAALALVNCVSRQPEVSPEPAPESKVAVPAAPKISLKPYHRSMQDEMMKSFDIADEIVVGVYTETYGDGQKGRAYYFDQYRIFQKDSWTWSPQMSALLPVLFRDVKPEIISSGELKSLTDLDRTGICWDDYEGPRTIFLVEGIPNLIFLRQVLDESNVTSYRILIDSYPLTKECRAKDIFDLMLRERAGL